MTDKNISLTIATTNYILYTYHIQYLNILDYLGLGQRQGIYHVHIDNNVYVYNYIY